MSWSAAQYVKFEEERTRPVRDLVQRIPPTHAVSAADIGCGPGNSTEVLRKRYPEAHIVGVDSSPGMIEAARKRLPGIAFEVADIREWRPNEPLDVILANAVLQWIPGHETLLPALIDKLKPGGALAAQMPDNLEEPSHRLMGEIAADGPWAAKLKDAAEARAERHGAEFYFRLLRVHAAHADVWRTTYFDPLAGARRCRMAEGNRSAPVPRPARGGRAGSVPCRYEGGIAKAYPAEPDGTVLLPFPRLFFVTIR
jgi:trans-aconitate 2-methyltransferase